MGADTDWHYPTPMCLRTQNATNVPRVAPTMIVMRSKTGLEMKLNHSDAAMMATASPRMGPSHLMTDHKNDKYKNVMDRLSKNQPPSKAAEERKDYKDTHRGNERRQYGWSEGLNINNPEHPYSRYGDIEKVSDDFSG